MWGSATHPHHSSVDPVARRNGEVSLIWSHFTLIVIYEYSCASKICKVSHLHATMSDSSQWRIDLASSPPPRDDAEEEMNTPTGVMLGNDTLLSPDQKRIRELELVVEQDAKRMDEIQGRIATIQAKAIGALRKSEEARIAAQEELERMRTLRRRERTKTAAISVVGSAKSGVNPHQYKSLEEQVMVLQRALSKRDDELLILKRRLERASTAPSSSSSTPSSPVGPATGLVDRASPPSSFSSPAATVFSSPSTSPSRKSGNIGESLGTPLNMSLRGSVNLRPRASHTLASTMDRSHPRYRAMMASREIDTHVHRTASHSSPPAAAAAATSTIVEDASLDESAYRRLFLDVGASHIRLGAWNGCETGGIVTIATVPTVCVTVEGGPAAAAALLDAVGMADMTEEPIATLREDAVLLGKEALEAKFGPALPTTLARKLLLHRPMRELIAIEGYLESGTLGEEETSKLSALEMRYKDMVICLLEKCFAEVLKRRMEGHADEHVDVVVVHNGGLPRPTLEALVEFLFETLDCVKIGFLPSATLLATTLVGPGASAIVVDVGCFRTHFGPVLSGKLDLELVDVADFGGETCTRNMQEFLEESTNDHPRGVFAAQDADWREYLARRAKHKVGFVAAERNEQDDEEHLQRVAVDFAWATASGARAVIELRKESFLCVEDVVVQIGQRLVQMASVLTARGEQSALRHVIITGGSAKLIGLSERLSRLTQLQVDMLCNVGDMSMQVNAATWTGGGFSKAAWLALRNDMSYMTSDEYFSHG